MLWGAAVVAASLLFSNLAAAQEEDPRARQEFEAGREAFTAGRHESALEHFRRAYELSGRAQLLYNIGVAADRLRRDDEALEAFEAYLEQVPDAENRGDVDARITVLRRQMEDAEDEEEEEEEAGGPVDGGARQPGPLRFTWVALGVAVVGAGLATYFWLDAGSTYDDLDASCGARGCTEAEIDDSGIETSVALTNVGLITAAVAGAGAVALFFLERSSGGSASAERASLGIGPGSLVLRGRF